MTPATPSRAGWAGVYRWFRCSPAYLWYARVFRPAHAAAVAADRAFFQALFARHGVRTVFDIGANVGDKAAVFRALAPRVVCVEADPDTAEHLRFRFRSRPGVVVEAVAVGDRPGQATLRRKHHSGFNTLSEKWATVMDAQALPTQAVVPVPVTTLDALTHTHGRPDYIKIDVEGYELPVVSGLAAPVPVLSFECNLPTFREETDRILDHLLALAADTRFNARVGDSPAWLLPAPVAVDEFRRVLDGAGATTWDVFALTTPGS
jgi:FkbM family methyltransferase